MNFVVPSPPKNNRSKSNTALGENVLRYPKAMHQVHTCPVFIAVLFRPYFVLPLSIDNVHPTRTKKGAEVISVPFLVPD
ncbi:MAG: hypothetical protein RRY13_03360 [Akkermansia sp.]